MKEEKQIEIPEDSVLKNEIKSVKRKGKCNMCGTCCKAIRLNQSMNRIKIMASDNKDAEFIFNNWEPITLEEALTLSPHLKTWPGYEEGNYYKCNMLRDNKCTVQDNKPRVCSEYPYYGHNLDAKSFCFYTPDCGFKVDVEGIKNDN